MDFFLFIIKKFLLSILLLFLVISAVFAALVLIPGNEAATLVNSGITPELFSKLQQPETSISFFYKYVNYLSGIVQLDFGTSTLFKQSVKNIITFYLPLTIKLALVAFFFQVLIAVSLAWLQFVKIFNKSFLANFMLTVYSIPSFVTGIILILVFSVFIPLFPISAKFWEGDITFVSLILPVLVLIITGVPVYYRYLSENIDTVARKNFVLYARSTGLSESAIFIKYILPNSLFSLISIAGIELGILLGGTLITEILFGLPGFGRLTVNAVLHRDYSLILGCTIFSSSFIVLTNFTAEIIKYYMNRKYFLSIK